MLAPALAQVSAPESGLVATIRDARHRVRVVVSSPHFTLRPEDSLHPSIGPRFDVEFTGNLLVTEAGDYRVNAAGASLTVAGQDASAAAVRLSPGRHPLLIRFRREPGPSRLEVRWQSDRFPSEPVPAAALSHRRETVPAASETLIEEGRRLAEDLGCVNCHRARSESLRGRIAPRLTGIGVRVAQQWIAHWLERPEAFRNGAAMPAVLDPAGRRDVATYLSSLKPAGEPGARKPPSRSDLARGGELFGTIGCIACHRPGGVTLDGLGSKTNFGALVAYLKDPSVVEPDGRMPSMLLTDAEAVAIAAYLVDSRNRDFEQPIEAGDAARGRRIVSSSGCLACHELNDGAAIQNDHRSPPLERMRPSGGCLADSPSTALPRYRLTPRDRSALTAFLAAYAANPDRSPAPLEDARRSLRQLNCIACHTTDAGPPAVSLPEAAPSLASVGAKLRTAWIDRVLTGRERVHAALALRMPHYQPSQVGALAGNLARAAGVEPGDGDRAPAPTRTRQERGAGMIGTNPKKGGLGCVGCHDWGDYKSLGEDGPQLVSVARRLRFEWYEQWMRNPARILSGTSMPNYFGSSPAARARDSILSLWDALTLGALMPLPDGLRTASTADAEAIPKAEGEAVIVRWDMPEATPAAIAVGLPGGWSYCFDAGESRLRYAWHGGFLDLTHTLLRKTDANRLTPVAKLLGEVFYRSAAFPLRVDEPERLPQRRFRGYRIAGGAPQFHYQIDGIDVHERITAAPDQSGLEREWLFPRVDRPMWLVDDAGAPREIPRGVDVRVKVTIRREAGRP